MSDTIDLPTENASTPDTDNVSLGTASVVSGHAATRSVAKSRRIVALTAAGLALGGVIAAALLTRGFGIVGEARISATGVVSLTKEALSSRSLNGWFKSPSDYYTETMQCMTIGGYQDIAVGSSVTIYDETNTIIGKGSLNTARIVGGSCNFGFTVENLPADKTFYQAEVAHRGKITGEVSDGQVYFLGSLG